MFVFNDHCNLAGSHAFLGASNYHWLNYSKEKLIATWKNSRAKERGTELHSLAERLITLKVKLPKNSSTLNSYVNDAIGFGMKPEVILYYSPFCFGTADAVSFKRGQLRIHDLKTGETPASMLQLKIYAALFCLEYVQDPHNIGIELRIYQSDDIDICVPESEEIASIMDRIVESDKILSGLKEE